MISRCVKSNQGLNALALYNQMQADGHEPDGYVFARVLKACASLTALEEGRRVHLKAIQSGFDSDVFVGSSLVDMYAKCGSMADAEIVFQKMPTRNVVTWTAFLAGYMKCNQGQKSLELFTQMQEEGVKPNPVTFVVVLNACASIMALEEGRLVHAQLIQSGYECDVFVGSSLVDMYAKCGNIDDAQRVFRQMTIRNLVSWNAMLAGYEKCEQEQKALELYMLMQEQGVKPDPFTFAVLLNACASVKALAEGRYIHSQVVQSSCETDVVVGNALVDMYAKCGSIEDAEQVFHKMPYRNVVSWTAMLTGYEKCEQDEMALELFALMQEEGIKPDPVTFVVVLNACASIAALEEGRHVHAQIIEQGCEPQLLVGNTLVDMYAKCGSIEDAEQVFHMMPTRNVVSWTVMVAGYVKVEQGQKALELFALMQREGTKPDPVTFIAVLNACGSMMALEQGYQIHEQVIQSGFESDVYVGSTLLDMYAKCGSIEDALTVFQKLPSRNVVSWTAMLAGYVKCKQSLKALELFAQMQDEGVQPNPVTFVVVLNACANIMALEEGRRIHAQLVQSGCEYHLSVGNTLVDMYSKCGSIEDAQRVFHTMPNRDVVSWTAMLGGFAMHGHGEEALWHFQEMVKAGVEINLVTFICLLSACSHAGLVDEGVRLFESMGSVYGISKTVEHYICMVDLLGRAGRLREAEGILRKEPKISKDRVALMALLGACRNHGEVEMGERIAQELLKLDPKNSSGYVLLSNIYAAAGQWGCCDGVQKLSEETGVKKVPGPT